MGYKHLTPDDHDAIWDKYGEGMNPNEIAEATGGAYHTVASLIKAHGHPPAGVAPLPAAIVGGRAGGDLERASG